MWLTAMAGVVIACQEKETHQEQLRRTRGQKWHVLKASCLQLKTLPVHKNTVLFQSFWGPCRSCRRNSSNIKSALHHKLRSLCRCPSYPPPRRAGLAWSTLLTNTATGKSSEGWVSGSDCTVIKKRRCVHQKESTSHLTQVCMNWGKLVCVHLHFVYCLF